MHVTIWNREECRKIAGNAAPLRRNLQRYLKRHPECEEYSGQDKHPDYTNTSGGIDPVTGLPRSPQNEHVPIWNRAEKRKVTGNAAPLRKNLPTYLAKHPEYEVYDGQDKLDKPAASNKTGKPRKPKGSKNAGAENTDMVDSNSPDGGGASDGSAQWPSPAHATASGAGTAGAKHSSATQGKVSNTNVPFQSIKVLNSGPKRISWANSSMLGAAVATATNGADGEHEGHSSEHVNITLPAVENPNTLSYKEIASSWSNNPDWVAGPRSPRSPGVIMNTSPPTSSTHVFGTDDIKVSGIPIPFSAGARARMRATDKGGGVSGSKGGGVSAAANAGIGVGVGAAAGGDVTMGGMSIGTSLGTPNGAAGIFIGSAGDFLDLNTNHRAAMDPMDMGDANIPQFSPSNFLRSVGSLKAAGDARTGPLSHEQAHNNRGQHGHDDEDVDVDVDDDDDDDDDDRSDEQSDDDEIMGEAGDTDNEVDRERSQPMEVPLRQPRISQPIIFRPNR